MTIPSTSNIRGVLFGFNPSHDSHTQLDLRTTIEKNECCLFLIQEFQCLEEFLI